MTSLMVLEGVTKIYSNNYFRLKPTNLIINKNEIVGVIGESGSGKTTLGRLCLKLMEPTSGTVAYSSDFSKKDCQIIYQDGFNAFNPFKTIDFSLREVLYPDFQKANDIFIKVLKDVSLSEDILKKYPHQLSGGELQRVGIARALLTKPKFIVCDEPLSSLDIHIQREIITLLYSLQKKYKMTYLMILHDLSIAKQLCHRLVVMYKGEVVEQGSIDEVMSTPKVEYTKMLLKANEDKFKIFK